jgi:hypothetical protein
MTSFPNTFHSGNWRLTISNIPLMVDVRELKYFDNYCKSIILPDYNILEYASHGPLAEMVRHPVSHKNDDLTQLQIDFKISENFENYLYFFRWMLSIRYREIDVRKDDRLWKNVIDRITLTLLDNQKRDIVEIYFTDLRLLNLSSIALDSGIDDEVIFTSNFSYEEIGYNLKNGVIS